MKVRIDPHNGVPVYRQILDQIRFQITAGLLPAGDELESVRNLAAALGVNSMTVSKAYSLLERERLVERRRGLQLVVAEAEYRRREVACDEHVREALAPAVTIVRQLSMSPAEAVGIFREMLDDEVAKRPMNAVVNTERLTKRYGAKLALDALSLTVDRQRVVGLIGQNGSGKTTLLDIVAGMALPTSGHCQTLGRDSAQLDERLLAQLGVVYQENRFLEWMSVAQHLNYFGSFYPRWDTARQNTLLRDLDLDRTAKVGHLSGGDIQKLGIITAVCHHPRLLLLDEPVSALDPIARESILKFILRMLDEDDVTIVVSSHALMDIERLVDWVVCLNEGQVSANSTLDALQERFSEWHVASFDGNLPAAFREPFVREQSVGPRQAVLVVENAEPHVPSFREKYRVEVNVTRLNLEKIYPLLVKPRP